jgi:ribulose-phosphate 3-epimerase
MIKIAPSLLSADFARLGEEIKRVEQAGADLIHLDVMDGHFVPNITLGPPIIKALRLTTSLKFDVHLMMDNPNDYIDNFIDAGADIISVHVEACTHLNRVIQKIKQRGKKAAVALNPATPLSSIDWVLGDIDMVLLMTVNPGFGGQSYIKSMTDKIRTLKNIIDSKGLDIDIEIDGGADLSNIYEVTKAGANVIVSGSTIFNAVNTRQIIKDLKDKAFSEEQGY